MKKTAKDDDEQYVIFPVNDFQKVMDSISGLIINMEKLMDNAQLIDKNGKQKK